MWIPCPPLDAPDRRAHFAAMTTLPSLRESPAAQLRAYVLALLMVAAATLAGLLIAPRWGNSGVDLLYLPAVLAAASFAGLGPALLAALAAALAYNFFFTAPHLTFRIDNPNDVVTVLVLFAVAVVTSQLAASVRRQARRADANAARNATIAGLARHLLACTSEAEIAAVGTAEIGAVFACNAVLVAGPDEARLLAAAPAVVQLTPGDIAVAALVLAQGEPAGRGVGRAVPTEWQFHPVRSGALVLAAVGLARDDGVPPVRADQRQLLDNLLDQLALALERARAAGEARALVRVRERDQVRAALLSSIGQDLGPGLKAIGDAARALRRSGAGDKTLAAGIGAESAKIERYLTNLLALGPGDDAQPIQAGDVAIDLFKHRVLRDGQEVRLTPKEFALLAELAKHRGRVLSHTHLLRTIWGPAHEKQIDYLRVAIRALRQKLEQDPSSPALILNEPAIGYRLGLAAG
jgi:two-component system sensor histidine kinase KdpD